MSEQRVRFACAALGRRCDVCFGTGIDPFRLIECWLEEISNAVEPHRSVLWHVYAELVVGRFAFCEEHAEHVYALTRKEMLREGADWVQ
jgi:hypothetical protein